MYDSLFTKIAAARGRDIPVQIINMVSEIFDDVGELEAKRMVDELSLCDNVPSNLFGYFRKHQIDYNARRESMKDFKVKDSGIAGTCTGAELEAFTKIVFEIITWHENHLVEKALGGICVPLDIEEWGRLGRPKTWSPIIDHFLSGYLVAYRADSGVPGTLLNFIETYHSMLVGKRKERDKKNLQHSK